MRTLKALIALVAVAVFTLSSAVVASAGQGFAFNGFVASAPQGRVHVPPDAFRVGDTLTFSFTLKNDRFEARSQCLRFDLFRLGIFQDSTLDENGLAALVHGTNTQQNMVASQSLGTFNFGPFETKTISVSTPLDMAGIFQFDVSECGRNFSNVATVPFVAGFVRVLPPPLPEVAKLTIEKVCPSSFTGRIASFDLILVLPGNGGSLTEKIAGLELPCNAATAATFDVPVVANAALKIHETAAPVGLVASGDTTITAAVLATGSARARIENMPAPITPPVPEVVVTPGVLSIKKTCDAGVTGVANFSIRLVPSDAEVGTAGITCGGTVRVTFLGSLASSVVVGTQVKIVETQAATNGKKAADRVVTLSASAEPPVTINNERSEAGVQAEAVAVPPAPAQQAAPAGRAAGVTVVRLAPTGGSPAPASPIPGVFLLLGVILTVAGALLLRRRRA